jgi:putative ABC transport system permease protein
VDIQPILAALRRNKFGAILICLQMAVTLAVLCNAIFVIQQRVAWTERPTGTDEANLFTMRNKWVGIKNLDDVMARTKRDLAVLRALPGVVDAYCSNSYPLSGNGNTVGVNLHPDQRAASASASSYFGDEHALHTLGLELVAGRNFTAQDVVDPKFTAAELASFKAGVIITRPLARELFPHDSAVGKAIYSGLPNPATVIGVVDRLQGPFTRVGGWGSAFSENSILSPFRWAVPDDEYIVRAKPGQLAAAMREAQRALIDIDPLRVLHDPRSLSDARKDTYQDDRAFVLVLVTVCIIMLAVTAVGIVGLTSYWVTQRRRQIGIRRALGSTRAGILRYFQTENLLIALAAVVIGCALTIGFNLWAVDTFEMQRMPYRYLVLGGMTILVLGQSAAFWPALRASLVPPALAARST